MEDKIRTAIFLRVPWSLEVQNWKAIEWHPRPGELPDLVPEPTSVPDKLLDLGKSSPYEVGVPIPTSSLSPSLIMLFHFTAVRRSLDLDTNGRDSEWHGEEPLRHSKGSCLSSIGTPSLREKTPKTTTDKASA